MTAKQRISVTVRTKTALIFGLIGILCLSSGCQAMLATFMLMTGGYETKAKYKFFKGKKVAVVCLAENMTDARYDGVPRDLAKAVGLHLGQNVKKIQIVPPSTVNKWLDRNDNVIEDFQKFGKDMEADMVLAIDLNTFQTSSHLSPGSYQGRSSTSFTVYNVKTGVIIGNETLSEYVYPPNSVQAGMEMRESDFKNKYVILLAKQIACYFYSYDHRENMAMDAHSALGR